MIKKLLLTTTLVLATAHAASAQNASTAAPPQEGAPAAAAGRQTAPARRNTRATAAGDAQARAVRAAFDSLVDGIRRADADAVMALYWSSPQLSVFNNNGTVTKGWEQANSNRQSLYAKVSDVKLDVRDVRVKTLGPSGAVVTCLWEQSQTADGQPERATGRLTIVYQKVGADWKIVHTHTSPDKPSPSNLLPSERTPVTPEAVPVRPPVKP